MGTISVFESVTLDGVMQGLGRPDEDTRGGFRYGGWGNGYTDEVAMQFTQKGMAGTEAMLFGHRTYDDLLGFWTSVPYPNPFTDALVAQQKYVASHNENTEMEYPNSTLVAGEATETLPRRQNEIDGVITVLGSGALVRSLHEAGLVDEYVLQIHPIVLGSGTQLFEAGDRTDLSLEESVTTTTGVLIARYRVT